MITILNKYNLTVTLNYITHKLMRNFLHACFRNSDQSLYMLDKYNKLSEMNPSGNFSTFNNNFFCSDIFMSWHNNIANLIKKPIQVTSDNDKRIKNAYRLDI